MSKVTTAFMLNGSDKNFLDALRADTLKHFPERNLKHQQPVLGKMLTGFAESLEIEPVQDIVWFLGLNNAIWYELTQENNKTAKAKSAKSSQGKTLRTQRGPNLPVDLSLALLCQFYDAHPSYIKHIDITRPDLNLLSELFDQATGVKNSIGPLLGRNSSAAYRWKKDNRSATPTVLRLASALLHFIAEDEYYSLSEVDLSIDELSQRLLTLKAIDKMKEWEKLVDCVRTSQELSSDSDSSHTTRKWICKSIQQCRQSEGGHQSITILKVPLTLLSTSPTFIKPDQLVQVLSIANDWCGLCWVSYIKTGSGTMKQTSALEEHY